MTWELIINIALTFQAIAIFLLMLHTMYLSGRVQWLRDECRKLDNRIHSLYLKDLGA